MANTGKESLLFKLAYHVPGGDKISHIFVYGLLALLLNLSTKCKCIPFRGCSIYLGSICVFIFVTLEEFSQHLIPTRTFDLKDCVASLIGILVFSFLTTVSDKHLIKKHFS
ncbi:VanZ family protein [Neptuniibacter sp.]|uniref:VanZ family protein n=1 Tax=Neptuniibacter sp. TaxID=1962643 RepID=UPI003B5981FC